MFARRSPRALVLRGAAVVVAVITTVVAGSDLATLRRRAAGLGPQVPALVATRDLPVGSRVRAGDLGERPVHRSQLPPGALTRTGAVRGRVVAVPILRGGFVARRNLAPEGRTGLDGIVPSGTRAVRVEAPTSIAPRRGAIVDVLASYPPGSEGAGDTVVVAAGALVLGTDGSDDASASATTARGVTLLVEPDEAHALADAQANAVLTLVLAPPEDAARPAQAAGR